MPSDFPAGDSQPDFVMGLHIEDDFDDGAAESGLEKANGSGIGFGGGQVGGSLRYRKRPADVLDEISPIPVRGSHVVRDYQEEVDFFDEFERLPSTRRRR